MNRLAAYVSGMGQDVRDCGSEAMASEFNAGENKQKCARGQHTPCSYHAHTDRIGGTLLNQLVGGGIEVHVQCRHFCCPVTKDNVIVKRYGVSGGGWRVCNCNDIDDVRSFPNKLNRSPIWMVLVDWMIAGVSVSTIS